MSRRLEASSGILSTGIGIFGIVYAVFAPTYIYDRFENGRHTTGIESWLQHGIAPASVLYIALMAALFIVVGILSVRDAQHSSARRLAGLWTVTVLLVAGAVFGLFGSGVLLLPGSLLALFAAATASGAHHSDPGPTSRRRSVAT